MTKKTIDMSVCTYSSGDFEVIIRNVDTQEEITFSGNRKFDEAEFDFINSIAPACVWTKYQRITPE